MQEFRYERKFVIPLIDNKLVATTLKFHPALFSKIYNVRNINNIYLDSFDLESAQQTLMGISSRRKYRIRWYGDLYGKVKKPNLEIKIKEQYLVRKEIYPLECFEFRGEMSPKKLDQIISSSDLPKKVKESLEFLKPALINSYKRSYHLSADTKYRLTIDTEMKTHRIRSFHQQNLAMVKEQYMIIELKYAPKDDDQACSVTGYFKFKPYKNSKYLIGIAEGSRNLDDL